MPSIFFSTIAVTITRMNVAMPTATHAQITLIRPSVTRPTTIDVTVVISRTIRIRGRSVAWRYAALAHIKGRVSDITASTDSIGATSARSGLRNAATRLGATAPRPRTSGDVISESSDSERTSPRTRASGSSWAYDGSNTSI